MTPESTHPQFNVNASLIRRLASEIVPDAVAALNELIKNAYDADADWVKIEINTRQVPSYTRLHYKTDLPGYVRVEDNGKGMTWTEVNKSWMNFSFSEKRESKAKEPTEKKRSAVGGQGMGRLGTARLGDFVELFTRSGEASSHVAFNWSQFSSEKSITDVPLVAEKISDAGPQGSSLWIFPLKGSENWQGKKGVELIETLQSKIFMFADRKSFQVTVRLDDVDYNLVDSKKSIQYNNQVYWENVWQKMSPRLVSEVIRFWDEHNMIRPGFSSEERARQVVLVIRNEKEKKIVGLTTAGIVNFKQLNGNNFYLYRSIILPAYRHPGLPEKLIVETRDFLEEYNKKVTEHPCIGILSFIENPRYQQFRREAIWPASKMAYVGMDKQGRHIRVYYFKGATI